MSQTGKCQAFAGILTEDENKGQVHNPRPQLLPPLQVGFQPFSLLAATATSPEVTTERVPVQPSLEQLAASDITSDSLRLSWSVRTGNFDSFLVQYKDAEGKSQSLPVEGAFRTLSVPNLKPSRRYKFHLYGISGNKRLGPLSVDAVTGQQ